MSKHNTINNDADGSAKAIILVVVILIILVVCVVVIINSLKNNGANQNQSTITVHQTTQAQKPPARPTRPGQPVPVQQ